MRVHAGNNDVHLVQHLGGEIEFAISKDIDLDAREHPDAFGVAAHSADFFNVLRCPRVVETVGEREILGMVGNGHVRIAALPRGADHLLNCAPPVGFDRVHVHVPANIAKRDQPG